MTRIIDEVIPIRSSGKSGGGGVIDDSRSFRIRTHGDTTGMIRHEYECPVHGRFERAVPRADVPLGVDCARSVEWEPDQQHAQSFCTELGDIGCTDDACPTIVRHYQCYRRSTWCPPLVAIGVPSGEVTG